MKTNLWKLIVGFGIAAVVLGATLPDPYTSYNDNLVVRTNATVRNALKFGTSTNEWSTSSGTNLTVSGTTYPSFVQTTNTLGVTTTGLALVQATNSAAASALLNTYAANVISLDSVLLTNGVTDPSTNDITPYLQQIDATGIPSIIILGEKTYLMATQFAPTNSVSIFGKGQKSTVIRSTVTVGSPTGYCLSLVNELTGSSIALSNSIAVYATNLISVVTNTVSPQRWYYLSDSGSEDVPTETRSELVYVQDVSGTMVTLATPVTRSYNSTNSPFLRTIPQRYFSISHLTFGDLTSSNGVWAQYVGGLKISDVGFRFSYTSLHLNTCSQASISDCAIESTGMANNDNYGYALNTCTYCVINNLHCQHIQANTIKYCNETTVIGTIGVNCDTICDTHGYGSRNTLFEGCVARECIVPFVCQVVSGIADVNTVFSHCSSYAVHPTAGYPFAISGTNPRVINCSAYGTPGYGLYLSVATNATVDGFVVNNSTHAVDLVGVAGTTVLKGIVHPDGAAELIMFGADAAAGAKTIIDSPYTPSYLLYDGGHNGRTVILRNVVCGLARRTALEITGATQVTANGDWTYINQDTTIADVFCTATNYTSGPLDSTVILLADTLTNTLPTAVGIPGREYTTKLLVSGTGLVNTTSAQTIDGSTSYSLSAQWKFVKVQSNGTNWVVVGNN